MGRGKVYLGCWFGYYFLEYIFGYDRFFWEDYIEILYFRMRNREFISLIFLFVVFR